MNPLLTIANFQLRICNHVGDTWADMISFLKFRAPGRHATLPYFLINSFTVMPDGIIGSTCSW